MTSAVVVVVGAALMRRVLGCFVERPAQRLRALTGDEPAGASTIRLVDGHVEAAVAHHLFGTGEALAVAELGPHHHRQQPTDPVLAVDQRPTARLTPPEALQVAPSTGATRSVMASIIRYAVRTRCRPAGLISSPSSSSNSRVFAQRIEVSGSVTPC